MSNPSTRVAGIDIGKAALDLALHGRPDRWRLTNDAAGWTEVIALAAREGVDLVGLEASGGYERGLALALRAAGLHVRVIQPLQIKAFAKMGLRRAKNDRLDAGLIAAFTALMDAELPPARPVDPRLASFADRLLFIEQAIEDRTRATLRLEHQPEPRLRRQLEADAKRADARAEREFERLLVEIRRQDDLARRLDLLLSVPGIGEKTALQLLVRMPELGAISRERAASLAGLAPYDHDSGKHAGERRIAGGRARVRTALYAAAMPAAYRWNPALVSLRNRLSQRGKTHKQAIVACARKLLTYANAVLERGTPWVHQTDPV